MHRQFATIAQTKTLLESLSRSFGLRPDVDLSRARSFFSQQEFSNCIGEIKGLMHLPLTIRVGYLKDPAWISRFISAFPHLQGASMSAIDSASLGRPSAFIEIPYTLPLYGSDAFQHFTVTMYVSRSTTRRPFATFARVMAHEMAHIVLHATRHELYDSEDATDLLPMLLGFNTVCKMGWSDDLGIAHGYLSRLCCDYAYHWVSARTASGPQRWIHRGCAAILRAHERLGH